MKRVIVLLVGGLLTHGAAIAEPQNPKPVAKGQAAQQTEPAAKPASEHKDRITWPCPEAPVIS
ncbi:hypothetical protein KHP62_05135 [Rhodobacteraceae bacterium NNCM2]|nr:hypothetical protein [Coraliihabitans acroporae]